MKLNEMNEKTLKNVVENAEKELRKRQLKENDNRPSPIPGYKKIEAKLETALYGVRQPVHDDLKNMKKLRSHLEKIVKELDHRIDNYDGKEL